MKITDEHRKLAETNKKTVDEWTKMFKVREEYAYYRLRSKDAAEQMISRLARSTTYNYISRTQKNSKEVRKKLRLFREMIQRQSGKEVSRPSLCSYVITQDMSISIMQVALHEQALGEIGIGTFVFWYDIAEGLSLTNESIAMALGAGEERNYQSIKYEYEKRCEHRGPIPPHQQEADMSRWKAEAARAARLLHNDPSGFTLIDETVAELKAEASGKPRYTDLFYIEPFQIPEFVVAGAEMAQAIYKALYPITENL